MRKLLARLKFIAVCTAVIVGGILFISSTPYADFLWAIPVFAVLYLFIRSLADVDARPERSITEDGYCFLNRHDEFEHRYIAMQLLRRDLKSNEEVHHINRRRADNCISNLCVMDRVKHKTFHDWLRKENRRRRRPSIDTQKHILENDYDGILLERFGSSKENRKSKTYTISNVFRTSPIQPVTVKPKPIVPMIAKPITPRTDPTHRLFNELKNERTRLAKERNVPAYVIFRDRTLKAMAETRPLSRHQMLEIESIGKDKYEAYGAYFLEVIRQFEPGFYANSKDKKDPA